MPLGDRSVTVECPTAKNVAGVSDNGLGVVVVVTDQLLHDFVKYALLYSASKGMKKSGPAPRKTVIANQFNCFFPLDQSDVCFDS